VVMHALLAADGSNINKVSVIKWQIIKASCNILKTNMKD
jgi:hypothetical protein